MGTGPRRRRERKNGQRVIQEWHALGREEQAKYYELARRERQLHMQLYPDWSSRANSSRGKKRKRKQETNDGDHLRPIIRFVSLVYKPEGQEIHSLITLKLSLPSSRIKIRDPGLTRQSTTS
ncbi:unnamed protein product [Timema podura]|uniref:HMG box domain-containing protein n=1 Tax=Timema podura TaxID=61482 RepID=A0ABN7PA21_TIMPD|nr:unnamed protein product [Timema podura]